MSKRNPIAADLARPQYRQRIEQARRNLRDRAEGGDAHARFVCEGLGIEYDEYATPQYEGWQETPRQMEG